MIRAIMDNMQNSDFLKSCVCSSPSIISSTESFGTTVYGGSSEDIHYKDRHMLRAYTERWSPAVWFRAATNNELSPVEDNLTEDNVNPDYVCGNPQNPRFYFGSFSALDTNTVLHIRIIIDDEWITPKYWIGSSHYTTSLPTKKLLSWKKYYFYIRWFSIERRPINNCFEIHQVFTASREIYKEETSKINKLEDRIKHLQDKLKKVTKIRQKHDHNLNLIDTLQFGIERCSDLNNQVIGTIWKSGKPVDLPDGEFFDNQVTDGIIWRSRKPFSFPFERFPDSQTGPFYLIVGGPRIVYTFDGRLLGLNKEENKVFPLATVHRQYMEEHDVLFGTEPVSSGTPISWYRADGQIKKEYQQEIAKIKTESAEPKVEGDETEDDDTKKKAESDEPKVEGDKAKTEDDETKIDDTKKKAEGDETKVESDEEEVRIQVKGYPNPESGLFLVTDNLFKVATDYKS